MDAGSRVVDLTSPLALAGIPIFFVTTYYSDFIIVPLKYRQSVVKALLDKGFECSADSAGSSFSVPDALSLQQTSRDDAVAATRPPSTPPPSTVAELQHRTFETLKKRKVSPHIEPGLSLVLCSGQDAETLERESSAAAMRHRPSGSRTQTGLLNGMRNGGSKRSWVDKVDTKLYTSLVAALISHPRFLSITLTEEDAPSLLLDRNLMRMFGDSLMGGPSCGEREADMLVPIFLDLVDLPFEATGIVSGVAGRLVDEMRLETSTELSYLSTAKTGAVVLSRKFAERALEVLTPLLPEGSP